MKLSNMTEEQLEKAYEVAVNHKNQVSYEIKELNNKLVFDKNNEKLIKLIAEKEELRNSIQAEIRAIRKA